MMYPVLIRSKRLVALRSQLGDIQEMLGSGCDIHPSEEPPLLRFAHEKFTDFPWAPNAKQITSIAMEHNDLWYTGPLLKQAYSSTQTSTSATSCTHSYGNPRLEIERGETSLEGATVGIGTQFGSGNRQGVFVSGENVLDNANRFAEPASETRVILTRSDADEVEHEDSIGAIVRVLPPFVSYDLPPALERLGMQQHRPTSFTSPEAAWETQNDSEAGFALADDLAYATSVISDSLSDGERSFIFGDPIERSLEWSSDPTWIEAVERSAAELLAAFKQWNQERPSGTRTSPSTGGTAGTNPRAGVSGSSQRGSSSSNRTGSNLNRHREEDGEENSDANDDNIPQRLSRNIANDPNSRLLACPYCKNNPLRYSHNNTRERKYRNCSGILIRSIDRLKRHLYQTHARPKEYCPICFMRFKNNAELEEHANLQTCSTRPCPFQEKMTKDQQKAIKRRRMKQDPIEAWYEYYSILFPGQPLPDDPYPTPIFMSNISQFMQFYEHFGPRRFVEIAQSLSLDLSLSEVPGDYFEDVLARGVVLLGREIRGYLQQGDSPVSEE